MPEDSEMLDIKNTLVKATFRCDDKDKKKLAGSSCILHISVGQEYHEDEKFIATMDLVNETFSSCIIILCDTLQRHTLRIKTPSLSEEEAYQQALLLGDEWLDRNKPAYSHLSIDCKIARWDYWLQHPHHLIYKEQVENLYRTNLSYRESVYLTIDKFMARQRTLSDDEEALAQAFKLCEQYILEECPILIPLWAETESQFVIYPRFRTSAMRATYEFFLQKKRPDLLREVALKFNHRTVPKPLSFLVDDRPVEFLNKFKVGADA